MAATPSKHYHDQYFYFIIAALFFFLNLHCGNSLTFAETTTSNVYIVYMGAKHHDNPATTMKSHHDMLATLLGSKEAAKASILYSYKHGFSGFAATLSDSQAKAIAEFPGVVRVFPNRIHKPQTTRSWDFLGLDSQYQSDLFSKTNMGDGPIIGVIDSGIWPESESFKDDDMGPIPLRWKGICQSGESFNSTHCNNKLIGARWFSKGYEKSSGKPINTSGSAEYLSPRDKAGHGTHCSSTTAGRFVPNVSYQGLGTGLARGGAPLARLAMYKACWLKEIVCTTADLLKAFDMAIHDGVDILSVSLGASRLPLVDYVNEMSEGIAVGAFHAVAKGITVVCAAGNEGPYTYTVKNTAPWLITVAATTIDRAFLTDIKLGNNQTFLGQSLSSLKHRGFVDIVYSKQLGIDDESDTLGSDAEELVSGKVVLTTTLPSTSQTDAYAKAGAVGLIFPSSPDQGLSACSNVTCVQVDYEIARSILSYLFRTTSAVVKLSHPKSVVGKWVSPRVATFSSRGPNSLAPAVLKPDIAAPGVNILAAYPPPLNGGHGYAFETGTSMACPQVAGVAALIKSLHKDWSPAAIKSAIVTTASQTGTDGQVIRAQGATRKPADPFDMGGGHVNPKKAADPGIIYDVGMEDYIQFLCSMGYTSEEITIINNGKKVFCSRNKYSEFDLNLPSISIPNLKNTITVSRTVTNVGSINSVYRALVRSPHGVGVEVEPQTLSFNSSTTMLSFKVTFTSTQKLLGDYSFGSLTWTDGKHLVKIPLAVRVIEYESFVDT